jgi:4-amino-4-deoxy-L-arabinose transferase-like glycosyltransferase
MSSRSAARLAWIGVVVLTLAVFALYAGTLDRQSLWFDEGLSVVFATRPLPELMHTLIYEDLHPPLYYLLLHFWMQVAGTSEWSVRLPSTLAAVLLVPLAFAVVREVWGHNRGTNGTWVIVGTAAAALVASSPFIAFYAQETRMYSIAAALALATTWAYLRATRTNSLRVWGVFSLLLAASLYTQYFSAFIVPAFWLYALLLDRDALPRSALSTVLAGLLFVPWARPAFLQLQRLWRVPDYWVTTRIDLGLFFKAMLNTFLPTASTRWGLAIGIGVALVLVRLVQQRGIVLSERGRRGILVLLTCLIPLGLTYAAVTVAPKFAARYAIVSAAPLYICAALVLYAVLGRRSIPAQGVFVLLILAGGLVSLRSAVAVVEGQEQGRDDARGLAAYLTANAQANDAVLLVENAPYALQYYYQGRAPFYGLHVGQDFGAAANVLNRVFEQQARRVWLVLWHHEFADPTDMVATELMRVGGEVDKVPQFRGYALRAFDIQDRDSKIAAEPQPETVADAQFWPGIRLLGFDRLDNDPGQLHYVLYWQVQEPVDRNYSLTLSLEDQEGNDYLRRDQALSTPYFLPPVWPVRTPIRGRVDLDLPADLPPITYRVRLRVLDPQSGRNLDLVDAGGIPVGQSLLLGELPLAKSDMSQTVVEVDNLVGADMGQGLELLGFDLPRLEYRPGDTLRLTLWWRAADELPGTAGAAMAPGPEEMAHFRLLDYRNEAVWEDHGAIVAQHPLSEWQAGEVNRSIYRLTIPSELTGGKYHLQAGVADRLIALTTLDITPRYHQYSVPPMQEPLGVEFEEGITLLGYDLQAPSVRPGETMTVTLYWRASEAITTSYKVSLQLLTPELRMAAQDDSVPVHWTYPTTAWLPDEIISDEHVLTINSLAVPGRHVLVAVLYEEKSGRRLWVEQAGKTEDHAILTVLRALP